MDELIIHMKSKGIKFNIVSEEDAKHFLTEHNYYFKLASYRANYTKATNGPNKGQYINLDFAYLKELASIDYHLRCLIMDMCIDIEHSLKILLLQDIEKNSLEDGYTLINQWDYDGSQRQDIFKKSRSSYCQALIQKYHPNYPIWVACEVVSFGDLCRIIDTYEKLYPKRLSFDYRLIYHIKDIRNAAAHNNCMISNLQYKHVQFKPNGNINRIVSNIKTISARTRSTYLYYKPMHDLIVLLYLYPLLVQSEDIKLRTYKKIKHIFFKKIPKNRHFFLSNHRITSAFSFIFKVINVLKNEY